MGNYVIWIEIEDNLPIKLSWCSWQQFWTRALVDYMMKDQRQRLFPGDGGWGEQGTNSWQQGGKVEANWAGGFSCWSHKVRLNPPQLGSVMRESAELALSWIRWQNIQQLHPNCFLGAMPSCWDWRGAILWLAVISIFIFLLVLWKRLQLQTFIES